MEFLKQLAKIVSGKRVQKIETLDDKGNDQDDNNFYKLFRAIRDGEVRNDEEAAEFVYNTEPSDKKYQMLKSRLKTKLFNNLFFLDRNKYKNEQFKAYYECYRNLFIGKIIRAHGFNKLSNSIFQKALEKAKEYELHFLAVDCLNELRQYAHLKIDQKSFENHAQDLNYFLNLLNKETIAQNYWERIALKTSSNTQVSQELIEELNHYCSEIETYLNDGYSSFNLNFYYYKLKIHYLKFIGYYQKAVYLCDLAERTLGKTKQLEPNKLAIINIYKFNNLLLLKDYKTGKSVALKCLQLLPEGRHNWFAFHQHYFLLAMHTRHYQDAFEIYQKIVNHKNFKGLFEYSKEKWRIFEAYLRYAFWNYASNSSRELNEDLDPKQFRIHKFLNEVPTFQRDKAGMNVAILIIQVLYYLQKEDFEILVDRMTPLKQYAQRYLRKPETYRSRQFIRMLSIMEQENFNYTRTKTKSQNYYDKLRKVEIHYEDDNKENLEIIPYEHLWIHVLNQLRHQETEQRRREKQLVGS